MEPAPLTQLTAILQASISPVALISGVGLLLLSLTNRFGRTTDRARALHAQIHAAGPGESDSLEVQVRILYRRSKILRASISLAAASILCASLLIAVLFLAYLFRAPVQDAVAMLFGLSFLALVASVVLFIEDVGLSLKALHLELAPHMGPDPGGPPPGASAFIARSPRRSEPSGRAESGPPASTPHPFRDRKG
jgi:hypothetical protein